MTTTTFQNTATITIPDSGAASPYPSTINVTGMNGTISNVTLTLNNLSHTWVSDIDVLLVGPSGQKVLVFSDVADGFHAINVTVTLSDAASQPLPSSGPFVTGTYKPTDYTDNSPGGDNFPPPAPAPPYPTVLSTFDGTIPNGPWSLYVFDDGPGDQGNFGSGWSLTVTTLAAAPSPTPAPSPASQPVNLSTRMDVQNGDNAGIGGFIISGTASKPVLLRAIGPSLASFGVPDPLADPVLELHGPPGFVTIINDNWGDDPAQAALIQATGLAPVNDLESAIDITLTPGAYTAIVRGNGNSYGVGLVEAYDLSQATDSKLANISTRALVNTGNDIVIGGFVLGNHGGADQIIARGIGPSLIAFGVPNALADPTLELRDGNGALLVANNDWQDDPAQAAIITAAGLAPTNPLESGIAVTLAPGSYTALLAGRGAETGVGLVEIYDRGGTP